MEQRSFREEQTRNKRASLLLSTIVPVILFSLIVSISYAFAPSNINSVIPLSLIFVLIYTFLGYQYGDKVVLRSTDARPADGPEFIYLNNTVEGLSIAAGIPKPKVYVIPSKELNAFATGKDPKNASIAVTSGLIQNLDRLELEGVIAHELSHIKNQDVQFMTLVAVLVGMIGILSHMILRTYRFRNRGKNRESNLAMILVLFGFILAIFAPIVTRLVQLAISRKREYLADASSVELTRYPDGLADALEKLSNYNRGNMKVSEAVSHLFITDPNKSALDILHATHPPIQDRIRRLREM
jgi:heat shock protein HtpX